MTIPVRYKLIHCDFQVPETTKFGATGEAGIKTENEFKMGEWAADKKPVWEEICRKHGGNPEAFNWGTWGFFDWAIGKAWPTVSSVTKARKFGWNRYDDTYESWIETFRSFENAGILPRNGGKTVPLNI